MGSPDRRWSSGLFVSAAQHSGFFHLSAPLFSTLASSWGWCSSRMQCSYWWHLRPPASFQQERNASSRPSERTGRNLFRRPKTPLLASVSFQNQLLTRRSGSLSSTETDQRIGSPRLESQGCVWNSGHLDGVGDSFRKEPGKKRCQVNNYQGHHKLWLEQVLLGLQEKRVVNF